VYFVLQKKTCPFIREGICIYVGHCFFYETQLDILALSVSLTKVVPETRRVH